MTRQPQGKFVAKAGFTLLEMLVALMIFALAIGVASPLLRPPPDGLQLRASARKLCAALRDARARAIASNSEFPLTFDLGRKSYSSPAFPETFLPARTAVELTIADNRRRGARQGDILFFPSGAATGGEITLSLGGRRATIEVNWLTGIARCEIS